jgi:hypothetical protein
MDCVEDMAGGVRTHQLQGRPVRPARLPHPHHVVSAPRHLRARPGAVTIDTDGTKGGGGMKRLRDGGRQREREREIERERE